MPRIIPSSSQPTLDASQKFAIYLLDLWKFQPNSLQILEIFSQVYHEIVGEATEIAKTAENNCTFHSMAIKWPDERIAFNAYAASIFVPMLQFIFATSTISIDL